MEAIPLVRSSLLGILLLVMKLSVLVSWGGGHTPGPSQLPQSCWTWQPVLTRETR